MSEQRLIQQTSSPRTRESLAHDLCALGVEAGMTLEVHSSLSKLGWVCGGPVAVVQALMDVVTMALRSLFVSVLLRRARLMHLSLFRTNLYIVGCNGPTLCS